jgi:hypothetical protein
VADSTTLVFWTAVQQLREVLNGSIIVASVTAFGGLVVWFVKLILLERSSAVVPPMDKALTSFQ